MKGNQLLIIIIVVLILVIIGGGIFAYMMINKTEKEESPIKVDTDVFELGMIPGGGGGEGEAAEPAPLVFITNTTDSKKIVKISMHIKLTLKGFKDKAVRTEFPVQAKEKLVEIKDRITGILRAQSTASFDSSNLEHLKEEIKAGIEEIVGEGRVAEISFVEIISQ